MEIICSMRLHNNEYYVVLGKYCQHFILFNKTHVLFSLYIIIRDNLIINFCRAWMKKHKEM